MSDVENVTNVNFVDTAKTFLRDLVRTAPFAVWVVLRFFLPKRKPDEDAPDLTKGAVLVFATNPIGDTVTLLPALQLLMKNQWPMKVDLLARPKTAPLFKFVPGVGDVITLEKLNFPFQLRALRSNISTLWELRHRRYQSAIIFTSNFWTAWVAFLIGAQNRYGFSRSEKVGLATINDFGFLLTHDKRGIRNSDRVGGFFEFLEWLKVSSGAADKLPRLSINGAGLKGALGKQIKTIAGEKQMVVLNPFATQKIREWPLEHWIKLANSLAQNRVPVVLCCDPAQRDRFDGGVTALRPEVLVLSDLSFEQFIGLLNKAAVVVTNDSGPLHLGYALRKPTVAIIGPTDPDNVVPKGADVTVVQRQMDCAPCSHLGSFERCPLTHHRCVKDINVDEVMTPIMAHLRSNEFRAGAGVDSACA